MRSSINLLGRISKQGANVIFRAIFRPHAFRRNLLLGMRSKFFVEKEKTVETLRVSTVWWRLGDSNPRPHACEACALTS